MDTNSLLGRYLLTLVGLDLAKYVDRAVSQTLPQGKRNTGEKGPDSTELLPPYTERASNSRGEQARVASQNIKRNQTQQGWEEC